MLYDDFDEQKIDLTPNSQGKTNTMLNQTESDGFTQHLAKFNNIKSKEL